MAVRFIQANKLKGISKYLPPNTGGQIERGTHNRQLLFFDNYIMVRQWINFTSVSLLGFLSVIITDAVSRPLGVVLLVCSYVFAYHLGETDNLPKIK